jgi:hypothetical protein
MHTIDIPDKICPHCGGIRWTVTNYKRYKTGLRYSCAIKATEAARKYRNKRKENPETVEKLRQVSKDYYNNNKEKRKASLLKYFQSEKGKIMMIKKRKVNDISKRKNLPNVYIRKRLKHSLKISPELITEETLNKYRTYLISLRQLRQLENEKTENISKKVRKH